MNIAEPSVTLTDYALSLECAILASLLYWQTGRKWRPHGWFVFFFCAVGFSALAGGTAHGFIHDKASLLHILVWNSTLIAIGVAALMAWMIAALQFPDSVAMRWMRMTGVALFLIYCVFVVSVANSFLVAIVYYFPATLFLLIAFGMQFTRTHKKYFLWGIIGLLLTFVATIVQQGGVGLHSLWFDHNALYHLIQAVALVYLFFAAHGIIRDQEATLC